MGVAFVHGVNTRKEDGGYQLWVDNYVQKFRTIALQGIVPDSLNFPVFSSYWGGEAAKFRWKMASLPEGPTEAFGGDSGFKALLREIAPEEQVSNNQFLLNVAQESLEDCVTAVYSAMEQASAVRQISPPPPAWMQDALNYVDQHQSLRPDFVDTAASDDELVLKLLQAVDKQRAERDRAGGSAGAKVETFSIGSKVDGWALAATKIISKKTLQLGLSAVKATTEGTRQLRESTARLVREKGHQRFGLFLGDVGVYLTQRGTAAEPGDIIKLVLEDFRKAAATKPFIVVAHSMGGNISYDILTTFDPELKPDLFLTVGSQVSLLEEAKLFLLRDLNVPSANHPKMPKPGNITRWLNVFDKLDPFAYQIEPVFNDVKDFQFKTRKTVFGAHGAYFNRDNFYERLRRRIEEQNP